MRLFLEHGYDVVTVAQIADAADVSLATLFAHVPGGKEALIFDDGAERRTALTVAVRDRAPEQPILAALRAFFAGRGAFATDIAVAEPAPGRGWSGRPRRKPGTGHHVEATG